MVFRFFAQYTIYHVRTEMRQSLVKRNTLILYTYFHRTFMFLVLMSVRSANYQNLESQNLGLQIWKPASIIITCQPLAVRTLYNKLLRSQAVSAPNLGSGRMCQTYTRQNKKRRYRIFHFNVVYIKKTN